MKRKLFLLFLIWNIFIISSFAASIKGKVIDSKTGRGISKLKVLLMGPRKSYVRYTNKRGIFEYKNFPAADYSLNIYFKEKLVYSSRVSLRKRNRYVLVKSDISKFWKKEGYSNLSGKVIDASSLLPIRKAYVFLDGGDKFTLTDKNGNYFFSDLENGEHIIKVKASKYQSVSKIVKLKKEEEYYDFELKRKRNRTATSDYQSISENNLNDDSESEYLADITSSPLVESGFEDALKKVSTKKTSVEERSEKVAQEQIEKLPNLNDYGLTMVGGTGLVDLHNTQIMKPGKIDLGMGFYTGKLSDGVNELDANFSAYKVVYGVDEKLEIGFSNLQRDFESNVEDQNSQFLNLKYKLNNSGPIKLALGYSYINDNKIKNSNLINLIGEYNYQTGRYLYNFVFNMLTATDLSDSVDVFFNLGLETSLKGSRYPVSYILELSQDEEKEFKILNLGVRLKKNPSFDFVFKKNISSDEKIFGLGSSMSF